MPQKLFIKRVLPKISYLYLSIKKGLLSIFGSNNILVSRQKKLFHSRHRPLSADFPVRRCRKKSGKSNWFFWHLVLFSIALAAIEKLFCLCLHPPPVTYRHDFQTPEIILTARNLKIHRIFRRRSIFLRWLYNFKRLEKWYWNCQTK